MSQTGKKYILIGVEGYHDQAAIEKLLLIKEFKVIDDMQKIDKFWGKLAEEISNRKEQSLYKLYGRIPIPSFCVNDECSIVVINGEGSNLKQVIVEFLKNPINKRRIVPYLHSFAIIADCDKHQRISQVVQHYSRELKKIFPKFPDNQVGVCSEKPKLGIFVFPDNHKKGTLDTLLVECAELVYPENSNCMNEFIKCVNKTDWHGFDKDKAMVATIVSVLRPGLTNTASI